jgi:hypothetical protein
MRTSQRERSESSTLQAVAMPPLPRMAIRWVMFLDSK